MARRLPASPQLPLHLPARPTVGGKRRGAGRKPTGVYGRRPGGRPVAGVSHRSRPELPPRAPLHVTVRATPGAPYLRRHAVARAIGALLKRRVARGALPCRVIHFSILTDHLHLVVEAADRTALARGMQGLLSGLARVVNRTTGCDGKLWRDRYHARALATPTEVRRCLVYVLRNGQKHGSTALAIDPCSSAAWFDGFSGHGAARRDAAPVHPPSLWLLTAGWRRAGGPIGAHEGPATAWRRGPPDGSAL